MHARVARAVIGALPLLFFGCKDKGKESAGKAAADVAALVEQVDKDVQEIERGLPEGAAKLASAWDKGPPDAQNAKKALETVRRQVSDLNVAKSTFFALADENGVAIRNDLEEDVMAGLNLVQLFPDLAKAKDGYTQTLGAFPGPAGKNGPDKDFLAAAPVKVGGKTVGLYVTGWTFRMFSRHLQESQKSKMAEQLRGSGDTGKLPIFYVGVFDKSGVYMAPLTPPVNEKALMDAGIFDKTASGPAQGTVNITDRDFGWAAQRTPKMGPDVGIVELRSEL